MSCLWKICFWVLILFGSGISIASAQVLTAEDLVQAGVARLSDILELTEDWVRSSTEGYHWNIAPLGASWEATPDWRLFIDGQPIDLHALNQQSLNVLPLAITEICEVRLHTHPVVVHGILASGGAIQIIRCTPETGISFEGQFSAGNETGDPGPYRYTSFGGSNVDRTGPTIHSSLAARSHDRFIRITGMADEHHATDPRIRPRVVQLYQGEKDARIFHRALGLDTGLFGHSVNAGTSRVEDLMFLPFMGREIPLDQEFSYASASFSQSRFRYSLSASLAALNTRQNPESVSIMFTRRQLYARASTHAFLMGASRLEYGVSAVFADARFAPGQERDRLNSLRVDAIFAPDIRDPLKMKILSAFSLDDGTPGYELFAHAWHEEREIGLRFLMKRRALASRINFASWVARGHHPGDAELHVQDLDSSKRESVYSADLHWAAGNMVRLYLSSGIRRYVNAVRPFTASALDSTQTYLQAVTGIISSRGTVARTSLRVHYPVTRHFTFGVHGVYAYPWSKMHTFRDAWHHRLQVGLRGEFRPSPRFSLNLRLRYVGSSTWHEFERAARDRPGFYAAQLPGAVHLHLTVQKRFWSDRLRMSATMRNVLDHPHLTHPAGARTRALFQVTLHYAFQMRSRDAS